MEHVVFMCEVKGIKEPFYSCVCLPFRKLNLLISQTNVYQVVCVVGDVSFLHDTNGLAILKQRYPIYSVLFF